MHYQELTYEARRYAPALALDRLLSRVARERIRIFFALLTGLFILAYGASFLFSEFMPDQHYLLAGTFLGAFAWLLCVLIEAMYRSYYHQDLETTVRERGLSGWSVPLSYTTARIMDESDQTDVTPGLVRSTFGLQALARAGVSRDAAELFLRNRTQTTPGATLAFPEGKVNATRYAEALFAADKAFADFLFTKNIHAEDWSGACAWVMRVEDRAKREARWWSRENLGRIPSLGKEWSYGQIYLLEQYGKELLDGITPQDAGVAKEVEELEAILVRTSEANALIVADVGSGEMDILYGLLGHIQAGTTPPQLEGKHLFQFDAGLLIDAAGGDKAKFESSFNAIMQQTIAAGNVLLVFSDLAGLIESARHIGADIVSLLYPFLTSPGVQVIAIADRGRYHESIENNGMLMKVFEILRVGDKDERLLTAILETEVGALEARTGLFFTYPAVKAVAESALRFFTEGVPLDKAKDLLAEIPPALLRQKKYLVERDDILHIVESKTGIPQEGKVSPEEKEKLLNLEKLLHERIVGQSEAIDAISNTMRRARAGLRNPNKPIGSFLFLGPTGVGKTETAKALAEIFFGKEAPMLRLDMSEYTGTDALERLIGSFELGKAGSLAAMLRDQQYGVLLLDEFEKTTSEVHNLFLQVLDEGFFSDMHGKKVNARNVIIIATSNAGSEIIYKTVEEGGDLVAQKSAIIDSLIARGLFRPELLNRFDDVVLFHPLGKSHITEIATLAAKRLSAELEKQGFKLNITKPLTDFLAREGFDQKFGARAMNRVLSDKVEKLLAEKILKAEVRQGSTLEFFAPQNAPEDLDVRAA